MAEFDCKLHFDVEADDAMMMQAYCSRMTA